MLSLPRVLHRIGGLRFRWSSYASSSYLERISALEESINTTTKNIFSNCDREIRNECETLAKEYSETQQLFNCIDPDDDEQNYHISLLDEIKSNVDALCERKRDKQWCYIVVGAGPGRYNHSEEWAEELFTTYAQFPFVIPIYRYMVDSHFKKGYLLCPAAYGYGIFKDEDGCHKVKFTGSTSAPKHIVCDAFSNVKVIAYKDAIDGIGNIDDVEVGGVSGGNRHKIQNRKTKKDFVSFLKVCTDEGRKYCAQEAMKCKLLEEQDKVSEMFDYFRLYKAASMDKPYAYDCKADMRIECADATNFVRESMKRYPLFEESSSYKFAKMKQEVELSPCNIRKVNV
eukprot:152500_1